VFLTISTTYEPATDLGYLLMKHPGRAQTFSLTFGQAHVVYPEAEAHRCTCALILDVDPVGLVRGKSALIEHYVNDRPYAASSFLSVAIAEVFGTAMAGRSKDRPELAATPIPLEATIAVLPCRGGEAILHRLFAPLGYQITTQRIPLDPAFPDWGESPYHSVTLSATVRLCDLLRHLYVLIPVLDNEKHYWVGDAEVEKLLRAGEGWLAEHPEKVLITARYLKYRSGLAREALARLVPEEQSEDDEEQPESEKRVSLHQQRLEAVLEELKACGAKRVLDLGCGEGRLLKLLLAEPQFEQVLGMDVSLRALERAAGRLKLDRLSRAQQRRVDLIHGSLIYRDSRLNGYDAAAVVEVIEHLEPDRLPHFERVLFEFARPGVVVLTTPNREYNVKYDSLAEGDFRHGDHRFEWTRSELAAWAGAVAAKHGYRAIIKPIGEEDQDVGAPSQMAVFTAEEGGDSPEAQDS